MKEHFLFFYPYTLSAEIGILCSHLPPKPCLPLGKTPTLFLPKMKLLEKEKHLKTFFYYTRNVQKCRKKKDGEIHPHTTSYHSYSVERRVIGVGKTT